MKTSHCVFWGISTYLKEEFSYELKQNELFQLFGGLGLYIHKEDNPLTPVYRVAGCVVDDANLLRNAGIKLTRRLEKNKDQAFQLALEVLSEKKLHPVFANCFYLPYDKKNYRKNTENHLIMLVKYDANNNAFLLREEKGEFYIDSDQLTLSRQKTRTHPFQSLDISMDSSLRESVVRNNIRAMMHKNAERNDVLLESSMETFCSGIDDICRHTGIHKTVALQALSKQLRHPNGTIISRQFMSECIDGWNKELSLQYEKLSWQWYALANDLLRLSHDNIAKSEVMAKARQLARDEKQANKGVIEKAVF